jgi:hypothetical protein
VLRFTRGRKVTWQGWASGTYTGYESFMLAVRCWLWAVGYKSLDRELLPAPLAEAFPAGSYQPVGYEETEDLQFLVDEEGGSLKILTISFRLFMIVSPHATPSPHRRSWSTASYNCPGNRTPEDFPQ